VPVVRGQIPLMLAVDRDADIDSALDLAREFTLKVVLVGAEEGWRAAARIAAAKVPVIVGSLNNIPGSFATLASRQENAALLRRVGVQVALSGGGESFNSATSNSMRATPWRMACRGMKRCAR